MRQVFAVLGSAIFFVIGPGAVAGLVPWWISRWRFETPAVGWLPLRVVGGLLAVAGALALLDSFVRFAIQGLGTPAPVYAISISGSLKQNLERIFGRYHWKVVWKAPYDYNFDGRITGASVPDVLEKLLKPFPLQAVMYMSNRTMVIVPRQKQHD